MPANSQDIENAISEVERHLRPGPESEESSEWVRETSATRSAFRKGAALAMIAVGGPEGDVHRFILDSLIREMHFGRPFMDTEWESYMTRIGKAENEVEKIAALEKAKANNALREDPQALSEVETACTELYAVVERKARCLEAVLQITQKTLDICHAPSTGEFDLEATRRLIGALTSHLKDYEAMRATRPMVSA